MFLLSECYSETESEEESSRSPYSHRKKVHTVRKTDTQTLMLLQTSMILLL